MTFTSQLNVKQATPIEKAISAELQQFQLIHFRFERKWCSLLASAYDQQQREREKRTHEQPTEIRLHQLTARDQLSGWRTRNRLR